MFSQSWKRKAAGGGIRGIHRDDPSCAQAAPIFNWRLLLGRVLESLDAPGTALTLLP